MAIKHTPGPWFIDDTVEPSHLAACMVENPSWVAIEDTADDGGHLAYCHPDNAGVIAAAPAMLENLRQAQQWIGRGIAEGAYDGCALPLAPGRWLDRVGALLAEIEKGAS